MLDKLLALASKNPARVVGLVAALVVLLAGKAGIVLDKPSVETVVLPIVVGELSHWKTVPKK